MHSLLPVLSDPDLVIFADAIYAGGMGGRETELLPGVSIGAPVGNSVTDDPGGEKVFLSAVRLHANDADVKTTLWVAYKLLCTQSRVIEYRGAARFFRYSLIHMPQHKNTGMVHTLRFTPNNGGHGFGNLLSPSHKLEEFGGWEEFQEEFLLAAEL